MLLIAHNMTSLESIADDVAVMDQGSVLTRGPIEQVRKNREVAAAHLGG